MVKKNPMQLVFASNNKNKLKEVRQILEPAISVLSLSEIGCAEELPETAETIEENASQKAWYVYQKYQVNCFADDTGLEIEALDRRPGVYSARYAGPDCNAEDNIRKVLQELEGKSNRQATFRCIISLILDGKEMQFEGRMDGEILTAKRGYEGFGYDPIFAPEGSPLSFAEIPMEQKNKISHRGKAVKKMKESLINV